MTGPAEIRLRDLTVSYERMPAVHHLSGAFQGGRLSAVMGPNGAGKSTLLKSLVGLLPLDEGHIDLSGLTRREIAYLPQHADLDTSFPITVFDVVAMGLWQELGLFGRIDTARARRVDEALETVGLPGFGQRPVTNLSVGQLQRVLFARLLIQDAKAILLDEPFAAVDERTVQELLAVMHRWRKEGRIVIAVLHDLAMARTVFDDALLLAREPVAWGEVEEALGTDNLARARYISEGWGHAA